MKKTKYITTKALTDEKKRQIPIGEEVELDKKSAAILLKKGAIENQIAKEEPADISTSEETVESETVETEAELPLTSKEEVKTTVVKTKTEEKK